MESSLLVDAVIVNYNGQTYLGACIDALRCSSVPVRIMVVDNKSSDDSVVLLRTSYPEVDLIALPENSGYAEGANIGIRAGEAPYVLILNPDALVDPEYLRILVQVFEEGADVGAAQGKLYRVRKDEFLAGELKNEILDSAGHRCLPTRFVVDRGQGETDRGQFDQNEDVFSACGAALFLRRAMLDEIAIEGEYFDSEFFAYKEDIDLCWRARNAGWRVRYIPQAVAYHVRGWSGEGLPPLSSIPPFVRRKSWANHYLMLIKNEPTLSLLRAAPFLLIWALVRQGYMLLRDRSLYAAYPEILRRLPRALRHRKLILGPRS